MSATITTRVMPMLWFDTEAEEAARFYVSVFPNSKVTAVSYYGDGAPRPKGAVMVVAFELDGQSFTALNAGPQFKFTEAISLVINCEDQAAVDHYWGRLTSDGGKAVACGWLKDRYGLCWQVIPAEVFEMLADPDRDRAARAHGAVMQMVKLDLAEIRRAYAG